MAEHGEASSTKSPNIIKFAAMLGKLKATARTGWVRCGVSQPESIAGHMYRMACLAFLLDKNSGLDRDRCIRLALVHDMAECIVGDITPWDGVAPDEKHRREKDAMTQLASLVDKETGAEFVELWQEYDSASTAEARFVKDLDKFDMIMQAHEYEHMDKKPGFLQQFFDSTNGKFQTQQVIGWVQELNAERQHHVNSSENSSSNNLASSCGSVTESPELSDHCESSEKKT